MNRLEETEAVLIATDTDHCTFKLLLQLGTFFLLIQFSCRMMNSYDRFKTGRLINSL